MATGSSNQITENSSAAAAAAYFQWPPPVSRSLPHGNAEEREFYFKGHRKDTHFKLNDGAMSPSGHRASTLLDLMTIRAYNSKLLRKVSVGTGVGYRTRRGVVHTDIPAIIVFVAHKVHKIWIHEDERLPTVIEGPGGIWCDVDVVEFQYYGSIASTQQQSSRENVYTTELTEGLRGNDPYIGPGSQVSSQETIGTLGAIVESRTGACGIGFLTNRHVAVNLDQASQKMYHPLPPNVGPGVYLGAVERATSFIRDEGWYSIFASTNPETFVRADGAFVAFSENMEMEKVTTVVKGLGEMGEVVKIDLQDPVGKVVGKKVVKVGRSSGLTKGRIMAYGVEYNDENGVCLFTDFLIVGETEQEAFDMEGDSGSLIFMVEDDDQDQVQQQQPQEAGNGNGNGNGKPLPMGMIWGGAAHRGCLKLHHGYHPHTWTSGVDLAHLLDWLQLDLLTSDAALRDAVRARRRGSNCTGESFSSPPNHHNDWPTTTLDLNIRPTTTTATYDSAPPHLEVDTTIVREINFGVGLQEPSRNVEYNTQANQISNFNDGGILFDFNLHERGSKRTRQQ